MRQTNPIHRLKACCSTRIACFSCLLTFRHCFSLLYSIWFPHSSICFIWIFSSESLFHTVRQYGWTHQLGSATGGNSHLAVFFSLRCENLAAKLFSVQSHQSALTTTLAQVPKTRRIMQKSNTNLSDHIRQGTKRAKGPKDAPTRSWRQILWSKYNMLFRRYSWSF